MQTKTPLAFAAALALSASLAVAQQTTPAPAAKPDTNAAPSVTAHQTTTPPAAQANATAPATAAAPAAAAKAAPANAQRMRGREAGQRRGFAMHFGEKLALTDAQKQQITQIEAANEGEYKKAQESLRTLRIQVREASSAGDTAKTESLRASAMKVRAQLDAMRDAEEKSIVKILTADQAKKYAAIQASISKHVAPMPGQKPRAPRMNPNKTAPKPAAAPAPKAPAPATSTAATSAS